MCRQSIFIEQRRLKLFGWDKQKVLPELLAMLSFRTVFCLPPPHLQLWLFISIVLLNSHLNTSGLANEHSRVMHEYSLLTEIKQQTPLSFLFFCQFIRNAVL